MDGLAPWVVESSSALLFAALVGLAFAPLELLFPARKGARDRKSLTTDLLFATAGAALTRVVIVLGLGALLAEAQHLSVGVGLGPASPLAALPAIARIAIGLLVFELGGYAYHRMAHRVPLLRRLHDVHHSSASMDWLAAFRQHPLEIVFMTCAQNLPLVVLGVGLGEHALIVLLLQLNTIYVHANLRVPRGLERLLATPRFHHRHHDRDAPLANYASLFPFLDRLFGTYDAADAKRVGLPDAAPAGFVALLLLRLRSAPPPDAELKR